MSLLYHVNVYLEFLILACTIYILASKTALLVKGFREAGQTVANVFRTFADKPEVDYSQKEQKHPITKAVLAPMKAVKKMLVSMELHLDASINKLDNLAMNVQLDKEKHMENAKAQEQTEPERAEAERVEAEVVYSPIWSLSRRSISIMQMHLRLEVWMR